MNITKIRDYIGLLAPIILFILTLFFLRNMKKYLYFFVSGFILNNILNILLKLFIMEPRPSNDQKAIEIGVANGERISFDKFGMPSGHAQNCGFSIIFIIMTLNNAFITSLYLVICIISLFQRYLYNNHTILQLAVGLFVGLCAGYATYKFANHYITGNLKTKMDDNFIY